MRIGIATDHGGFALKEDLVFRLRGEGHDVADFGARALASDDDYPDLPGLCHSLSEGCCRGRGGSRRSGLRQRRRRVGLRQQGAGSSGSAYPR